MDAYETVHESLRSLRMDTVDAIIDNYPGNAKDRNFMEVLGDEVMASAVLDRILHHSTTVNIRGESYRLRERRKYGLPR